MSKFKSKPGLSNRFVKVKTKMSKCLFLKHVSTWLAVFSFPLVFLFKQSLDPTVGPSLFPPMGRSWNAPKSNHDWALLPIPTFFLLSPASSHLSTWACNSWKGSSGGRSDEQRKGGNGNRRKPCKQWGNPGVLFNRPNHRPAKTVWFWLIPGGKPKRTKSTIPGRKDIKLWAQTKKKITSLKWTNT